jgi:hypothetical protein
MARLMEQTKVRPMDNKVDSTKVRLMVRLMDSKVDSTRVDSIRVRLMDSKVDSTRVRLMDSKVDSIKVERTRVVSIKGRLMEQIRVDLIMVSVYLWEQPLMTH